MTPSPEGGQGSFDASAPPNRAEGVLRASFRRTRRGTAIDSTHEAGGLRLRFPNVPAGSLPDLEAVCINTGGGMVGGDTARLAFEVGSDAAATITTQSAEKIYRSEGPPTMIAVELDVDAGGTAEWLPQETILYDGVRLRRNIEVRLGADATLLMVESLVFGRLAMGETLRSGMMHDRWRVRRSDRLVFAEDMRLEGAVATILDRPAIGAGARAFATVLLIAPECESRLDTIRATLEGKPAEWGVSAWNGMLLVRILSPSPDRVRATILPLLMALRGRAAPRVWQ